VGIGTASPSQKLDVAGDARVSNSSGNKRFYIGQATPSANDGASLEFQNSNTQFNWAIRSSFNVGGGLEFCPSSAAGGVSYTTPSMVINSAGVVSLKGAVTNATGVGITFPATQSASSDANTLDDYEEGTWTPTITRNSSNPTITYGTQLGVYVKIGRIVYVSCNLNWSANTGGSGSNWFISGLPFTNTNGGANYAQATIQDFNGITFSASRTQFGGYVNANETRLFLCSGGSNQSTDNITVGSSGYMYMSGVYIASA
jgi:hypothetical protein